MMETDTQAHLTLLDWGKFRFDGIGNSFGAPKGMGQYCPTGFVVEGNLCTLRITFTDTGIVSCTALAPVMDGDRLDHQEMKCVTTLVELKDPKESR